MSSEDEDFDLIAHAYVYKNDGVYPGGTEGKLHVFSAVAYDMAVASIGFV